MPENDETAHAGEELNSGFKGPSSQEELDRIIQKRLDREREKYADYESLRSTVATQTDRISELESTNASLEGVVARFEQERALSKLVADVAAAKGVPATALRGTTEDELNAHADELKKILAPSAPVIPGQEHTPGEVPVDPLRAFTRDLFKTD